MSLERFLLSSIISSLVSPRDKDIILRIIRYRLVNSQYPNEDQDACWC